MYLIEYNEQGKPYKITPDPVKGLGGIYVNILPVSIEDLLENQTVEEHTENNKKYYIIKER